MLNHALIRFGNAGDQHVRLPEVTGDRVRQQGLIALRDVNGSGQT